MLTRAAPAASFRQQVMRDAEHVNRISKGFGFVEFSSHAAALAALRMMNNNPAQKYVRFAQGGGRVRKKDKKANGGHTPRLIVEFAIENHVKMQQQQRNRERRAAQRGDRGERGAADKEGPRKRTPATSDEAKPRSRGAIQREKRRLANAERPAKRGKPAASGGKAPRASEAQRKPRAPRSEDDAMGRILAADMAKGEKDQRKRSRKKVREEERQGEKRIETLVKAYKEKLFSGGTREKAPGGAGERAAKKRRADGKRWFE